MQVSRIVLSIIAAIIIFEVVKTSYRYKIGVELALKTQAVQVERPNASMNILVIGDSTALGVGATEPEHTLVGLWAQEFPEANIENIATNGHKLGDVSRELRELSEKYDLIFIHAGGNDVIRFTATEKLKENAGEMLHIAKQKGERVIWMSSGNIGAAPFFPFFLRPILSAKSKQAREIFMSVASENDVAYVDLFTTRRNDPFRENKKYNYAPDFLHPGDGGYKIWFDRIKETQGL